MKILRAAFDNPISLNINPAPNDMLLDLKMCITMYIFDTAAKIEKHKIAMKQSWYPIMMLVSSATAPIQVFFLIENLKGSMLKATFGVFA